MEDEKKSIAAVVMASGFSRRFGSNKLLLPWKGGTVIEAVLELAGSMEYAAVAVVSRYDEILAMAARRGFIAAENPAAEEGKAASVRIGASVVLHMASAGEIASPGGVIFFTGDQVLLTRKLLEQLKAAFLQRPASIVIPVYDGRPGSPVTFPADMLPRLTALKGEEGGMKAALEQPERIFRLPAIPGRQGLDIDTPEAWEAVRQPGGANPPQ